MASLKNARGAVDQLVTGLAKEKTARINLDSIDRLSNDGFARVTASVVHAGGSREDHAVVVQALCAKMGNKLRPVEGSFHAIASNAHGVTISGIVTCNPEAIVYEDGMDGFKAVAGNMFMDTEENLWALRKTEAGNLLVKSRGAEDADIISDLMQSLSSSVDRGMGFEATASARRDVAIRDGMQGGDFLVYVDPVTESVQFGAVVAGVAMDNGDQTGDLAVIASGGDDSVVIDRGMVLASVKDVEYNDDGLVADQEAVAANAHSLDEIAAYYSQVFRRDPAYFEQFMARWKAHSFM